MKNLYLYILIISLSFTQVRLSFDSNSIYGERDIKSGISLSYDKILIKQANVKVGIGLEHMFQRDIDENTFKSNSLYYVMRFVFEKKWSSYLRIGYNHLNGFNVLSNGGAMLAFGADYKINDLSYIYIYKDI